MTEADQHTWQVRGTQLIAHFLVDRDGVIRWGSLEAERRPDDLGAFPTEAEFPPPGRSWADLNRGPSPGPAAAVIDSLIESARLSGFEPRRPCSTQGGEGP